MQTIYEEFKIETTAEEKNHGLRRIERRFRTKPGEMTLRDCKVIVEIEIDADVFKHFESEAGEENYKTKINSILREKMEESLKLKAVEMKKLRWELLEDKEFLQELREKLVA